MRNLFVLLTLAATVAAGCSVAEPTLPAPKVKQLANLTYPADAERGKDLDIVISRDGSTITLVNRTSRSHMNVRLWINQQYVAEIAHLPVGKPTKIATGHLINRYHEALPEGGALQPDKSRPIISAELHDPHQDRVWPLYVRLKKDWQRVY